jgi:hypothetical protein
VPERDAACVTDSGERKEQVVAEINRHAADADRKQPFDHSKSGHNVHVRAPFVKGNTAPGQGS